MGMLRSTSQIGLALFLLAALVSAGCTTTGPSSEEGEAVAVEPESVPQDELQANSEEEREENADQDEKESKDEAEEGEVAPTVAESEHKEAPPPEHIPEVVIEARDRFEVIHDLVAKGQSLLRDVKLEYFFTGKGKKETLRGRPVAF